MSLLVALALAGCVDPLALTALERDRLALIGPAADPPLDPTNRLDGDPRAEWLGQALFFDPALSAVGVSCASCHPPEHGFADPAPLSEGAGTTRRHAPTVLYAGWQRWLTWDGAADSLWMQALGPIEHPDEMATPRTEAARRVATHPVYGPVLRELIGPLPDLADRERFPAARPVPEAPTDPLHLAWEGMDPADRAVVDDVFVAIGKALAAYERRLAPGPAPFDAWAEAVLDDEPAAARRALSDEARLGAKLFLDEARCHACHLGPALSNLEFHNLDLPPPFWARDRDWGRADGVRRLLASPFNAAGPHSDAPDGPDAALLATLVVDDPELAGRFRTPPLRDVARTAPYMHSGHFETLREVVDFYAEPPEQGADVGHRDDQLFLPLELDEAERDALVALLEALTGAPLDPALLGPPGVPP